MLYALLKWLAIVLCRVMFSLRVYGSENIPKDGGFILASNHASHLDPVIIGVACNRQLSFMARHDLFQIPFFSSLISWLGAFPVKRDTADLSALKEAMRRLRQKKAVLIFPEGTRMVNGGTQEPQPGIGFLVAKVGVPVVPTFVKGTDKALPKHAKIIRPHRISVHFGKQIFIERRLPYQDIANLIMRHIRQLSCSGT